MAAERIAAELITCGVDSPDMAAIDAVICELNAPARVALLCRRGSRLGC